MQFVSVLVQENFSAEHIYSQNTISPHFSMISPLDLDWGENIVDRAYKLNLVDEVDSSQNIYSLPTIAIRSRRTTCFPHKQETLSELLLLLSLCAFQQFFAFRLANDKLHTHTHYNIFLSRNRWQLHISAIWFWMNFASVVARFVLYGFGFCK